MGCHALLQRIFLNQVSNLWLLCLLHWQTGCVCVCVCVCVFSTCTPWEALYLCCVLSHFSFILFFTLWTVVCQAPLSMGLPR